MRLRGSGQGRCPAATYRRALVHDDTIAADERAVPFDDLIDPKFPGRLAIENPSVQAPFSPPWF